MTIEFERRGYPDLQIKGLRKKGPKVAGIPAGEAAARPAGQPLPRGLSFDELRAMMEADLREAEAATADEAAEETAEESAGAETPDDETSGSRVLQEEPAPDVSADGQPAGEPGEDDDLED